MRRRGAIAFRDYEQEIKRLETLVYIVSGLAAISMAANFCLIVWASSIVL